MRVADEGVFSARTDNVSCSGAHMILAQCADLRVGDVLQVELVVPYEFKGQTMVQRISSPARVVRVETLIDEDRDRLGLAVQFEHPQPLPV